VILPEVLNSSMYTMSFFMFLCWRTHPSQLKVVFKMWLKLSQSLSSEYSFLINYQSLNSPIPYWVFFTSLKCIPLPQSVLELAILEWKKVYTSQDINRSNGWLVPTCLQAFHWPCVLLGDQTSNASVYSSGPEPFQVDECHIHCRWPQILPLHHLLPTHSL
jgi:hypothetical protein